MAQRLQVTLVDDVDGGEAHESLTFGLDGVSYEIDLSADHAAQLRDALADWINAARRVSTRNVRAARRSTGGGSDRRRDIPEIREWARANGHEISGRGRVPAEIIAAYDAR